MKLIISNDAYCSCENDYPTYGESGSIWDNKKGIRYCSWCDKVREE